MLFIDTSLHVVRLVSPESRLQGSVWRFNCI